MNGELDFEQSLRARVGLLKVWVLEGMHSHSLRDFQGLSTSVFEKISQTLEYTPGAHFLCKVLRQFGYKMAVISGGFVNITAKVKAGVCG